MPRVLLMQRTIIPQSERKRYLERVRQKLEHYQRANCRFWVFEERALPGAFLEFIEAADAATLTAAHDKAPEQVVDPGRMYTEVELS